MFAALQIAEVICGKGPLEIRAAKGSVNKGYSMSLEEALKLEEELANQIGGYRGFYGGIQGLCREKTACLQGKVV